MKKISIFLISAALFSMASMATIESRAQKGGEDEGITQEKAWQIEASQLNQYSSKMRTALIAAIVKNNNNDEAPSFERIEDTSYHNSKCTTKTCYVFGTEEKQVGYLINTDWQGLQKSSDNVDWIFSSNICIDGVGEGGSNCDRDGQDNEELIAILPNVKKELCEFINPDLAAKNKNKGVPLEADLKFENIHKFTGTYSEGLQIQNGEEKSFKSFPYGCFTLKTENEDSYYFYYVLLAR